jgi:CubicO group peptidase (beta-lactamase class C family)
MQRRWFLKAGSSLTFGVLSSVHWPLTASRAADNTLDDFFLRKLDRVTTDLMTETKVPGAAIALVRDGKLFWSGGFGIKSTNGENTVDADTIFEAASVSKTVFAYAILKLCDQGKLDLDRPLTKYVPWRFLENDPRLDQITARQILSHSAGFQDWRSGDNPLKIHFTPGEKFMYSGEGYFYLQSVLTHLTGQTDRSQCAQYEAGLEVCATDFGTYMSRNLLRPFGMTNSTYQATQRQFKQMAHGHDQFSKAKPPARARGSDVARYGAAGGLLTTANDYAKFILEIVNSKPQSKTAEKTRHDFRLSPESRTEMFKPQIKLPADQLIDGASSWALGWAVQERADAHYLVHSGGQSGFRSLAMASPKNRSGFIILTNSDHGAKLIYNRTMLELLDRVLASAPTQPP